MDYNLISTIFQLQTFEKDAELRGKTQNSHVLCSPQSWLAATVVALQASLPPSPAGPGRGRRQGEGVVRPLCQDPTDVLGHCSNLTLSSKGAQDTCQKKPCR